MITWIGTKLMFEGKVGSEIKFLDENASNTVLHPTSQVVAKHYILKQVQYSMKLFYKGH